MQFRQHFRGAQADALLLILGGEAAVAHLHGQIEVADVAPALIELFQNLLRRASGVDVDERVAGGFHARIAQRNRVGGVVAVALHL